MEREPLLKQLQHTIKHYSRPDHVWFNKSEHAIFIPTEIMINAPTETKDFIMFAKKLKANKDLNIAVHEEKVTMPVPGINFVFTMSQDTKFDEVAKLIDKKLG